jgi:hypothetical protein
MSNPKYNKAKGAARQGTLEERLFSKRNITEDGCWEFTGYCNNKGYGMIYTGKEQDKLILCHRASYELYIGPIPDKHFVLHKCDNPPCFNPDHLFSGTHKDNMADMRKKDRHAKLHGMDASNARLTPEQVQDIRNKYVPYGKTKKLADEYGISTQYVLDLVHYRWRKNG